VKKTISLIASLAVVGLIALPGGAMAGNDAPKNEGPKGNAYGKMIKKINKKAEKKCKNKKGKAKKNCVKKVKRHAYGKVVKDTCGVSFGQLRKMARQTEEIGGKPGKEHVTPSMGVKKFVTADEGKVLAAHCEDGHVIVPEMPAEE